MSNITIVQSGGIDNPIRRLPWIILAALVVWATALWGFGLLLGHMSGPEASRPIEARIIEMPSVRHTVIPRQPVRKTIPMPAPARTPPPVQQKAVQEPVQAHPAEKPVQSLASPAPAVSLPETKLPPAGQTAPGTVQPRAGGKATASPQTVGESITPPQFGAAYLNNPKPVYPLLARKNGGIEGEVMLKVLVSREGAALKVEVARSSGHEVLDNAAVQAVKSWRFIPARRGDTPIEEVVQVPVAFHLSR